MTGLITRDFIYSVNDLPREKVEIPEWGGKHVFVQPMTSEARDAYEVSLMEKQENGESVFSMSNLRAKIVAACACNENGERIFSELDVPMLGKKNGAAIDRIFSAAKKINALTDDDVEEIKKKSEEDQH